MAAYYNEYEPYAAQWLRNLIKAGLIADGEVDERSIEEVQAYELKGFTQCHFFAGIGGWSYAARLAGWDDDRPLWTGSCPCQPFSAAGKQRGTSDERHLWPVFYELIRQSNPPVVFGEQVASRLGRDWLSGVRADLETVGYAVGAADLCAASVGAPHIRQRLWWVADANYQRLHGEHPLLHGEEPGRITEDSPEAAGSRSECSGLADSDNARLQGRVSGRQDTEWTPEHGLAGCNSPASARNKSSRLGDTDGFRRGSRSLIPPSDSAGEGGEKEERSIPREETWGGRTSSWSGIYIPCADGKARRLEPSIEPLAHGVPNRVGRLRAYGNAIVPQVAAEFIKAVM